MNGGSALLTLARHNMLPDATDDRFGKLRCGDACRGKVAFGPKSTHEHSVAIASFKHSRGATAQLFGFSTISAADSRKTDGAKSEPGGRDPLGSEAQTR